MAKGSKNYVVILFVNSCAVGFLTTDGFVCTRFESCCKYKMGSFKTIRLSRFPQSEKRESVRCYYFPTFFEKELLHFQTVADKWRQVENVRFISGSVSESERMINFDDEEM